MSSVQPTVRRFPMTAETLAESNLPFSCVVTPMREKSSSRTNENNVAQQQLPPKKKRLTHHNNYPLLASIPKCMRCGAPHPTKETHFWPYPYSMSVDSTPSFLVCYLCGGKTTNDQLPPPTPAASLDPVGAAENKLLPQIFQIPLMTTPATTFWSLPASACPPVCWFLLDGSCAHRSYWNTMAHLLLQIIGDIPPHVHVGILLAATVPSSASEETATNFSYVDLTSPVPHMLNFVQYADEEDATESGGNNNDSQLLGGDAAATNGGGILDRMALVPADSLHMPNIHAAIRSLVDYDPSAHATTQHAYTMSMPIGTAIETILDFMDRARHPGSHSTPGSSSPDPASDFEDEIYYAGGKIMTFLSSCPTDLRGDDWRPLTRKNLARTTIGLGGFGGAVQKNVVPGDVAGNSDDHSTAPTISSLDEETGGMPAATNGSSSAVVDTDMTPSSLLEYYRAPEHVESYFSELGTQCAEAALGVDLFVLVKDEHASDGYYDDSAELDVGLPFLRILADRSGAPGPLVFPLHEGYDTPITKNPDILRMKREIFSRVPWGDYDEEEHSQTSDKDATRHQPMAFGGELRLRLSPSFAVDSTPVDSVDEGPQLAPLYSSGGIMGPASEEDESGNLWRFGTCDPFTSVTIDLDLKDKKAKDRLKVDGMGEIAWKPVIQTCFAYTTIVKDPERPGEYLTVREMRIAHARAPLTDNIESLYSSIDPEVVGTVLFHKLTLTLLRDGLSMVQTIGEDWLKSLLVCAYQSAEAQEELQRSQAEYGLQPNNGDSGDGDNAAPTFYANERLLDREGELSAEEVLLGQGHDLIKALPLIVYSLLQCDAIRPSSSKSNKSASSYFPTMDARCAAGAQMSSMNPTVLARCIAPRLQLWSCNDGLILDMVELRMEAVRLAIDEFGSDARSGKARGDLVLLLDSPDSIVLCDATYFSKVETRRKKKKMTIGKELQAAVTKAANSYRTPPTIIYDLGEGTADNTTSDHAKGFTRLIAAFVEDLPGSKGAATFKEWGNNLAGQIHDELDQDDEEE